MPEWLPLAAWLPVTAPVHSTFDARSPEQLEAVVAQFDVEHDARYHARDGQTWCSTLSWDFTRAMGCEVPHWADAATGEPRPVGKGVELNANHVLDWLLAHGQQNGWLETNASVAKASADMGRPVLVLWKNEPGPEKIRAALDAGLPPPKPGPGHVAVGVPSRGGPSLLIAQAGASNFVGKPVPFGFGTLPVRYFVHP
jgi:hypothetical protein